MPKIQPYVSRVSTPGAVDVTRVNPETMGAAIGRGYERLGAAIAGVADEMQRAKEQAEISDLSAKMAVARADLSIELQERVKRGSIQADPETGEYTFTEDFKTLASERMEEIRGGISTRRGELAFQEDSTRILTQMTVAASEAQSQLVGLKARKDYETAFNARTSTLLNNPSSFTDILAENDADIDRRVGTGQLPYAVGEDLRSKSRKQISKAFVEGWAKLDTKTAKDILDKGEIDSFIDSDTKTELYGKVNAEERAARVEANLIKQQEKEAREELQQKQMDELFQDIARGKSANVKSRVLDSGLPWQKQKQLLDVLEAQTTRPIRTDKGTFLSLYDRIHAPDGDPKKIVNDEQLNEFAAKGLITIADLNRLRKEVRGANTQEGKAEAALKANFLNSIKANLIKKDVFGNDDPDGQENYVNFLAAFEKSYQKGRETGKSPEQLLTTTSPDYLGSLAQQYYKSPQQRMKAQVQAMRPVPSVTSSPTPEPRKSGESAADYLKRIKK